MNALAQLITPNNIALDIDISSQEELFAFVGSLFEKNHGISAKLVQSCLQDREALGSTGLGKGVAIPHGRVKSLNNAHIAFIRTRSGIDFKAPDNQPVQVLVIMLVPDAATQTHLDILSHVAQALSDTPTKELLFSESSPDNIYQLLTAWNQ
ncbi:MAG: IIA-like nitrogen-regulatory protein PtsN [Pseudomonadota bacterium]|jgi:PTS system nitrogen regulatory IIA component